MNLPYLVLPLWYAPGVAKLLEMVAAAGFMFVFLRRVGLGKPAALLGGLIYAFTGFQVVWTNWPQTHVGALIPALFWAVERVLDKKTLRSSIPLTLIASTMLFEGFPAVTGYAAVAVGLYTIARLAASRERPRRNQLLTSAKIGIAFILALGVCALQLLPFIHSLGVLNFGDRAQTAGMHLPLKALVTLAIPDAFGSPVDHNFASNLDPSILHTLNYIEIQSFIGATALVLIVICAARSRELKVVPGLRTYLWLAVLVTGTLIFVGGPLLAVLQKLPLFADNFIGRLRSVLGFLLAVLAALGFEIVATQPPGEHRHRAFVRVVYAGAGVFALLGLYWTLGHGVGQKRYLIEHSALAVSAGVLTCVVIAWGRRIKPSGNHLALFVIPLLVAAESLAFAAPFWPRIPREEFYPLTPVHQFLLAHIGADRMASEGRTMVPGTTTFYGLRALTAHTFYQPTWKELILAVDAGAFRSPTLPTLGGTSAIVTSPILDRLSVHYFVASPEAKVIGQELTVSAPSAAVGLPAGSSLVAQMPSTEIRAVVVRFIDRVGLSQPAFLSVQLTDSGSGEVLGSGQRRVLSSSSKASFAIPVTEDQTPPGSAGGTIDVRISLIAPGGRLTLGADAGGRPALSIISGSNDGLRIVLADGAVVYERQRALPRIRWASTAEVIADPAARIAALETPIGADTVVLSQQGPPGAGAPATLDVSRDLPGDIRVSVDASGGGYLIVADAMQDGWRAYVDGQPALLRDADHAGVAVFVPVGIHVVAFRYVPSGWSQGRLISLLSLIALICIGVAGRVRWPWRARSAASPSGELT